MGFFSPSLAVLLFFELFLKVPDKIYVDNNQLEDANIFVLKPLHLKPQIH